jgi:putative membrane protein
MDMDILQHSIRGLPAFALYFATTLAMLVLFITIYIWITPYQELELIKQGNTAAASSLSGAMLGFVIPLAHSVAQSASLLDMALWGLIALVVQLLVYFAASRLMPHLAIDIPAGKIAPGVFLGALSLATGILNAACMTY